MQSAISSGVPALFMGAIEIAFLTSSLMSGVSMTPGHTQLTLMLCAE